MTPRLTSRSPRTLFLLALLTGTLAACDSAGGDDLDDGTFQAQVSGHAQAALRGQAAFAVETQGGQTISAVGLINTEDDEDAVFLVLDGQPTAKTYPVTDEKAGAILILHGTGDEGDLYIAESGSITVTRADAGRMTGSFDVTAVSLADEDDEVRLRGSFSAEPGAVAVPDDEAAHRPAGR